MLRLTVSTPTSEADSTKISLRGGKLVKCAKSVSWSGDGGDSVYRSEGFGLSAAVSRDDLLTREGRF